MEQRAWQLVRPQLERRSRRWYDQLIRVSEATRPVALTEVYRTGPGVGAAIAGERRRKRLACLQFALCDLVDGLSPEQCQQLREHDVLPDDFVARVVRQAKRVRKEINW